MTDSGRASASICWECDTTGVQTTVVTVNIGDGHATSLALCNDCFRLYWVPLVEDGVVDVPSEE